MLVISTTFVRLVGMCLAVNTCAVFAWPAAIDLTPKSRGGLERRDRQSGVLCDSPDKWLSRECLPRDSPGSWQDVCRGSAPRMGHCAKTELCVNYFDGSGGPNTGCVPILNANEVVPTRDKAGDPRIGTSDAKTALIGHRNQFQWDVKILDKLGFCGVFAVVLSDDKTYILEPKNIIVGKIQGKEITACKGETSDPSRAMQCYPQFVVYLDEGDTINFTWGMIETQTAVLHYAIIPQLSEPWSNP